MMFASTNRCIINQGLRRRGGGVLITASSTTTTNTNTTSCCSGNSTTTNNRVVYFHNTRSVPTDIRTGSKTGGIGLSNVRERKFYFTGRKCFIILLLLENQNDLSFRHYV